MHCSPKAQFLLSIAEFASLPLLYCLRVILHAAESMTLLEALLSLSISLPVDCALLSCLCLYCIIIDVSVQIQRKLGYVSYDALLELTRRKRKEDITETLQAYARKSHRNASPVSDRDIANMQLMLPFCAFFVSPKSRSGAHALFLCVVLMYLNMPVLNIFLVWGAAAFALCRFAQAAIEIV
jgi:hypothetical protein